MQGVGRRTRALTSVAASLICGLLVGTWANPTHMRVAGTSIASVDFSRIVVTPPENPVSTTISTYGSPVTADLVARNEYSKIVRGQIVRIPLQWNGGNPVSSAAGGTHTISGDAWVNTITSMGGRLVIVLGGSTDNNFTPADAAAMALRYHPYAMVLGNEAGSLGIQAYTGNVYLPAARAVRAADPSVLLAGPGWAWYDAASLQYFTANAKGFVDIVDYHHYGTGVNAPDDATLMSRTGTWRAEIAQIRSWLNAAGMSQVQIQVGEYNLAWQFADGRTDYLGGDGRFYTAFNTAWSASVIGNVLEAGGRSIAYSQQNGALGIMVEPGNNDGGHPDGTPMPIYHGIGAFQGEGLHAGLGPSMVASSSANPLVDVFAGSNHVVVVVNRSPSPSTIGLTITGGTDGTKPLWVTNTVNPFANPSATTASVSGGQALITLAGYQVGTLIDGVSAPSPTPLPTATPSSLPTPTPTPAPSPTPVGLQVSQGCVTSAPGVVLGGTLGAGGSITNTGATAVSVMSVVLAARPPGGTNSGGPYLDFGSSGGPVTLGTGVTYHISRSKTFGTGAPPGTWYCYVTYQTADGRWHDDSRDAYFAVWSSPPTATPTPTPSPGAVSFTQACTPQSAGVARGGTLTVTGRVVNTGGQTVVISRLVAAGRPPGGSNSGGPYDDFAPAPVSLTLAPGQSYTLTASETFSSTAPPGTWRCYLTFQTPDGAWHDDGVNGYFQVT